MRPGKTLIIMVAEQTDRMLSTILSRTQLVRVPPLAAPEIREGLLNEPGGDQDFLEDAVRRANGNYNLALTTLRKDEQELQYFDLFTGLMRLAYSRKIIEINDWVDAVAIMGRDPHPRMQVESLVLRSEDAFGSSGGRGRRTNAAYASPLPLAAWDPVCG